jgi:hypothetical protein
LVGEEKMKLIKFLVTLLAVGVAVAAPPSAPTTPAGTFTKPVDVTLSEPIVISNKNNVVIAGVKISNPNGNCIEINSSTNITIKDSVIGPCAGTGIEINDSSSINVIGNYIENTRKAINGVRSTGVIIDFNYGKNNVGPSPHGQLVQFDKVYGAGNKIRCNASDVYNADPNTTFSTPNIRAEDHISIYMSSGVVTDNILVAYNRIRGGSSFTGSGIMIGDYGGNHITVRGNRVVNPWNTGISNAGGNNNTIEYNKIFSNMPNHVANEGMYVRNFTPQITACFNITHRFNQLTWPPDDWSTQGWTQKFVNPNQCGTVIGTATNNLNATLTADIYTEPISECRQLAQERGYNIAGW